MPPRSSVRTAASSSNNEPAQRLFFVDYHRIESAPTSVHVERVQPPSFLRQEFLRQEENPSAYRLDAVTQDMSQEFEVEFEHLQTFTYSTLMLQLGHIAVGRHGGRRHELHLFRTDSDQPTCQRHIRWVSEDDQSADTVSAGNKVYAIADRQVATAVSDAQLATLNEAVRAHVEGNTASFLFDVPTPSGEVVRDVCFTLSRLNNLVRAADVRWFESYGGTCLAQPIVGTRLDPLRGSDSVRRMDSSPHETWLVFDGILSWYAKADRY